MGAIVAQSLERVFDREYARSARPGPVMIFGMDMPRPRSAEELEAELPTIRRSPADRGTLDLIVRRPAPDGREVVESGALNLELGLEGDDWLARGSRHTDDGTAEPARQLTVMNSRTAAAIAGGPRHWALAGDQLYVDLDLSTANLPAGTTAGVGEATIEISAVPHTGCAKFARRFGLDAARFVNSDDGRALNLRGINARVLEAGPVATGEPVVVLSRSVGAPDG